MCGRYSLTLSWDDLKQFYHLSGAPPKLWNPRYNVAPGQDILVIGQGHDGAFHPANVRWGWPGPRGLLINARMEHLQSDPVYRRALIPGQRVIVPADGFYEWERGVKAPWRFTGPPILSLAALLLRSAQDPFWRVVLITRAADEWVSAIHHRMPWLLTSEQSPAWLRGPLMDSVLATPSIALTHYPVSRRINQAACEGDPALIQPVGETLP